VQNRQHSDAAPDAGAAAKKPAGLARFLRMEKLTF